MGIDNSTPLPPEITTLIQITVQKTLGRYRLTESDRDDLEQQIAMEVVRRRHKLDSDKAKENTFLSRVVKHALADILTARKAACRDYRREEASLSQYVQISDSPDTLDKEWATRRELICQEDAYRHRGANSLDSEDVRDLSVDLADAVSKLSPHLQEVLEQYAVLGSARKVAKVSGRHHSTVAEDLKKIKRHFENAGLEIYLSNPTLPPSRW